MKKLSLALLAIFALSLAPLHATTTVVKASKAAVKAVERTGSGPDVEVVQRMDRAPSWSMTYAVNMATALSGTTSATAVTLTSHSSSGYVGPLIVAVANRGLADVAVILSDSATAITSSTGIPYQHKVAAGTVERIAVSRSMTHAHIAGLTATATNIGVTPGNYE